MPISSQATSFWAPSIPPIVSYNMDVNIRLDSQTIEGVEKITFVNRQPTPLRKLVILKGLSEKSTLEVLLKGQELCLTPHPRQTDPDTPILVELPAPLNLNETIELEVGFRAPLPIPQHGALRLQKWHPRLWWGYPTCDDFAVRVEAPSDFEVVASGKNDGEKGFWKGNGIRTFGIVLGRDFERKEAHVGSALVTSIFEREGRKCAELLLETSVDVIEFYRSEFEFYPQPFLAIVPGMDRPAGGFNFATGIVSIHGQKRFGERSQDWWRWITAHEIGHQYWGECILEGDSPGWLWIALGIYMDREYARARGLDPELHRNFFNRYLKGVQNGIDTTVARPPEQLLDLDFDHNNIVVHGKGFAIISALESVVGRDIFQRIYMRCLAEFKCRRLGIFTFQMICEEETGQNLDWFFDQWVRSNRYLSYRMESLEKEQKGSNHFTRVCVERLGTLEMPVPVEARFEDASIQRKATDRISEKQVLIFESKAPVREVVVDPDRILAFLETPPKPTEQDLKRKISEMRWTGVGEKARRIFVQAQEVNLSIGPLWFKLGLALYDGSIYSEALEAFHKASELSKDKTGQVVSWVWQGHILDLLGRRAEALGWYQNAHNAGSRGNIGSMQHSQYGIVIDADWIEQRLRIPFKRADANTG